MLACLSIGSDHKSYHMSELWMSSSGLREIEAGGKVQCLPISALPGRLLSSLQLAEGSSHQRRKQRS